MKFSRLLEFVLVLAKIRLISSENRIVSSRYRQGRNLRPSPQNEEFRFDDVLPPSNKLWCSFLNFCVDESDPIDYIPITEGPSWGSANTNTPSVSPVLAPTVMQETLCEFMQLCDTNFTTTNIIAPDTEVEKVEITINDPSRTPSAGTAGTPTLMPTQVPTMTPTFKPPPAYERECEFLENCEPTKAPQPTVAPTEVTPEQTQTPTTVPEVDPEVLENEEAKTFLCATLGWCDLSNGLLATQPPTGPSMAPTSVAPTLAPTPAPTRQPALLCLLSQLC